MDRLSHVDLTSLAEPRLGPCVTLYLSLQRGYPAARDNPARLREALDRAEQRLRGYSEPLPAEAELTSLLAPALGLTEQEEFWRGCSGESLAVLLAPGFSRFSLLPFSVPTSVDVGRHFRLAPLVRLADWPVDYFVVALSMSSARLFHATPAGLAPLELPRETPLSLSNSLAGTETGRAVRFQASVGGSQPFFHGGTSHVDDMEVRRQEYVRAVAEGVAERAAGAVDTPVLLAAAEELHPLFRAAYSGPNLVEPGIFGCPDHMGEALLRERSAQLMESRPSGRFAAARDQYLRAEAGKTADTVEAIVPASLEGRVHTLMLAFDRRVWGERIPESGQVHVASVGSEGPHSSEDLTETALLETLRHSGQAFVVPQEEMPDENLIAAVLRW